jgi:glutaminase
MSLIPGLSSDRLSTITEVHLQSWLQQTQVKADLGRLPTYIPCLAEVDPALLAVTIQSDRNTSIHAGNIHTTFVLMSLIKPFLLLYLLTHQGSHSIFSRVGVEASDQPFHSVSQLAADRGRPRNAMINSGAISLASLLPGYTATERCEQLRQWLNFQSGCQLVMDESALASVRSLSNESNRNIARMLNQAGYLEEIDIVLDTYNQICCLSGSIRELGQLGLLLAKAQPEIPSEFQRMVNSVMLTSGLYESSSQYALRIGLPIKSGVSGGLLAIVPRSGSIAIYSPAIDDIGNSVGGLFLLEQIAQHHHLSLFQTD